MRRETKLSSTILLILVICLFAACHRVVIEPTPEPTELLTQAPTEILTVPTETLAPTPTPIPNGLVSPDEIEEFYYTTLLDYATFLGDTTPPLINAEFSKSQSSVMKEFLDNYYQEGYLDENGIEKAVVKSSPGVLFWLTSKTLWDYTQEPESDISISPDWCLYSPETASCVLPEPNFEQKITVAPLNTVTIFLGDDFIPESIEQPEDFLCTLYLTRTVRSLMNSWWDELTEEEMERLITANLTYKLLNGEIYTYGPPPRECPYVELILLE